MEKHYKETFRALVCVAATEINPFSLTLCCKLNFSPVSPNIASSVPLVSSANSVKSSTHRTYGENAFNNTIGNNRITKCLTLIK